LYAVFIYFYHLYFFVHIAKIILQIEQQVKDCQEVSNLRKKLNNKNKSHNQVYLKARILKIRTKLMKRNLKHNQAKVLLQYWDIQTSISLKLLNYKKLYQIQRERINFQKKEEN